MNKLLLIGSSIISRFCSCSIPKYEIINKGVEGLITSNLHKININNDTYDYMVFYCGNNDLKQNIDKTEVVITIENYLHEFTQKFMNTQVIVLSLLSSPQNHKLQLIDDIHYINQKMKDNNNVTYIDVNNELLDQKYYFDDGVHLNYLGYRKLNSILETYIFGQDSVET